MKDIEETFGVSAAALWSGRCRLADKWRCRRGRRPTSTSCLEGFGDNKIAVIKVVREITGLA